MKPSTSINDDDENIEIAWEPPTNQGGGQIKVKEYVVEFETNDGEWKKISEILPLENQLNQKMFCDGADPEVIKDTFCSLPLANVTGTQF